MSELQVFKKLPAVLATQRTYILSDAAFFNVFDDGTRIPVDVIRRGVRATNNTPKKKQADGVYIENDVRNLQMVDSAKTRPDANGIHAEYSIAFTDIAGTLSSIAGENDKAVKATIEDFTERAKTSKGLVEVANRYARNILNGRWLFRNRTYAKSISITVHDEEDIIAKVDAHSIPLNNFKDYSDPELELGLVIADSLRGSRLSRLTVTADIQFLASGSVEIYPSQNYKDGDGSKLSRSQYVLNKERYIKTDEGPARVGDAAIRDQKVANAIRTIDTWYDSDDHDPRPIPVEQYGANLEEQRFFRRGSKKNAFYFMKNLSALDPESGDGMFMTACLIRGAVYAGDKE